VDTIQVRTYEGKLTFERCRALLERFLSRLEEEAGGRLLAVALFGSVARGEAGKTSDLDLLIIHRGQPGAMLDDFLRILRELRQSPEYRSLQDRGFLPDPYPVFFTREQLAGHPWLLLEVLDHGHILLDREGLLGEELGRLRKRMEILGTRKVVLPDGSWYWDLKPDWKPGEVIEL